MQYHTMVQLDGLIRPTITSFLVLQSIRLEIFTLVQKITVYMLCIRGVHLSGSIPLEPLY